MNSLWSRFSFFGCLNLFIIGAVFAQQHFPQPPYQVQNVQAIPGDGKVELRWDETLDSDGGIVTQYRVYYGTNSVQLETDSYDDDVLTGSTETFYTVSNLENGVPYYFAMTAIDDEEGESESYSVEVTATPGVGVQETFQVQEIRQISDQEVRVTFSDDVVLKNGNDSFVLEEKESLLEVPVREVTVVGNTLSLMFDEQALFPGKVYRFVPSSLESKGGVVLSTDESSMVEFVAKDISGASEEVSVKEEPSQVVENDIEFGPELPEDIKQEREEEEVSELLYASASREKDTTPPGDATNLAIDLSPFRSEGFGVLTWDPAFDVDEDIIDQVLFTRQGLGVWDDGYSLGKGVDTIEIEIDPEQNYEVRLVTVDKAGNRSRGIELPFSTALTQTGPGVIWVSLALIALFFLGIFYKRRHVY